MPSLLKVLRSLTTAGPIINLGYASYQGSLLRILFDSQLFEIQIKV
jgi:hypothetical protein